MSEPTPKLLALDTSTLRAAVCLVAPGEPPRSAAPDPAARHGRTLVPALRDLLAGAGLTVDGLDGLVVGLGPGSYTGLRVGVTAAKTMAYAAGKPLAAFDSLELLARNAPADAPRVAVISDAQRGDVYHAEFVRDRSGGPLIPVAPTRIVAFEAWSASAEPGTFVVGPAVILPKFAGLMPEGVILPDDSERHWPDPAQLAALAREVWATGRRVDPFLLEPAYLRRSAAEEQWERLGR